MKALIVEDSQDILETVSLCLNIRWPDMQILSAKKGIDGLRLMESETPDVVILDLGLPDMDGMNVLKEIRAFSNVPVLVVTARGDETSRVKGLESGADDYIVKPFSHTELLARVKAVLRRTQMPELWGDEGVVTGGLFMVDLAGRRLMVNGIEVNLTPTEWGLLTCLVRNEGRVIPQKMLAEKVWGSEHIDTAAIKMSVYRLRRKLGDDLRSPRIIHSRRGLGYSFTRPH